MARDRQRAKQRKARRAGQNPGPERSEPHRANVPGELEHASGEADEFDAALVAGAGGSPRDEDVPVPEDDESVAEDDAVDDAPTARERRRRERERERGEFADEDDDLVDDVEEDAAGDLALEREALAAGGRRSEPVAAQRAEAPSQSAPGRFLAFLRASWAELQRVQWPDRRQVAQATAVVIGFVIVAGLYLGLADRVAQEIVDFII